MWRVLILALMTGVAACGIIDSARAQTAQPAPKAAPKEPAPKPAAPVANTTGKTVAKPESKPAAPHAAVAGGAEPTLIGQFGTWGAYSAAPNGKKVCFALAKPSSSKTNPPNRPRDPAYAFVSTRPAEKVNNEVSVMIGYALKPGSESSGSRTRPRKSGWSRPCANPPISWSRASRPRGPRRPTPSR
jgi:hypothetical protein